MGENINYWQIPVNWADGVFVRSLVEYVFLFFLEKFGKFLFSKMAERAEIVILLNT